MTTIEPDVVRKLRNEGFTQVQIAASLSASVKQIRWVMKNNGISTLKESPTPDGRPRTCTKCRTTYPATNEHFGWENSSHVGLKSVCRGCERSKMKETMRLHRQRHPEGQPYEIRRRAAAAERKAKQKADALIKQQEKKLKAEWLRAERLSLRPRAIRERQLPHDFTVTDYAKCREYFGCVCAYCGKSPRPFDRSQILQIEHFIPISSRECPGTVKTNIVPACQTCNFKKNDKDPYKWIMSYFGQIKGAQILAKIEGYFLLVQQGKF